MKGRYNVGKKLKGHQMLGLNIGQEIILIQDVYTIWDII